MCSFFGTGRAVKVPTRMATGACADTAGLGTPGGAAGGLGADAGLGKPPGAEYACIGIFGFGGMAIGGNCVGGNGVGFRLLPSPINSPYSGSY